MIRVNEQNKVNAKDIYSFVGVKTRFNDWIRNCIDYADLQEGKDFYQYLSKSTGGRPSKEYEFTLQAAKEVCIVSATSKAKQLRRWLIELSDQKENYDLLTHDQVVMLAYLEGFFKYIENQKIAANRHADIYVQKNPVKKGSKKNPYANFHDWRNEILNIEPQKVDDALKQYCIDNSKRMPKITSKRDKIQFLDEYDNLKNAVWDFLSIQGEVNALKLSELVKRMAKAHNNHTFERNETNLFQKKDNTPQFREFKKRLKK